ncbi:hypothetical protein H2248_008426 [Termitomyces sp. 'cryptogamus']|nr:hypothetical protein H2248_008426 [Termitomyces sp. 'cryptogamus']
MRSSLSAFASLAILLSGKTVATTIYGQCGGDNFTGDTACTDSGTVCTFVNQWYSQCLPGTASASATSTTTIPTSTTSTTTAPPASTNAAGCSGTLTKFQFFGVNESGAEFGNQNIPGVLGTDYTWPSPSSIDYFVGKGFNTFRVTFLMERLSPPSTGLSGAFDATYLNSLTTIVNYITNTKNAYAVVDPHNYMRYNGAIINSSDFSSWWTRLAGQFKSNPRVIFDLQNEPNGIDATTVAAAMQSAVNAIRAAGATTQLILVEGTSWTGAWTWTSSGNAAAFASLTDPNNNIAIEMHQYLDSDGSGTSDQCVSSTIGSERIADATAWLKAHNFKGFLGEIGAGSNANCIAAVQGALCAMQQSGVWIGALWWAAGPWWGTVRCVFSLSVSSVLHVILTVLPIY